MRVDIHFFVGGFGVFGGWIIVGPCSLDVLRRLARYSDKSETFKSNGKQKGIVQLKPVARAPYLSAQDSFFFVWTLMNVVG